MTWRIRSRLIDKVMYNEFISGGYTSRQTSATLLATIHFLIHGRQTVKKIVTGVLVVVLLILATSIASAEGQPPGVDSAVRISGSAGQCGFITFPDTASVYSGLSLVKQYSNGATGHSTYKCKLELVFGPPAKGVWKWRESGCDWIVSLVGEKGMMTLQCDGQWYP